MKYSTLYIFFVSICILLSLNIQAGTVLESDWKYVVSGSCSDQTVGWWSSSEAIRIAENVLLYQRDIGGWPKDTKMQLVLTQAQKDALIAAKPSKAGGYCTIDNGAVLYELTYLSKVYAAISDVAFKAEIKTGFLKGIQYLLDAQYDNGGWPQFYPLRNGYWDHITYNDNAMVHVMNILRHVYQKDSEYSIIAADSTVADANAAFNKGVECMLNTQYYQQGLLTSWCAQHDEVTLAPVLARSYELPSLSGAEAGDLLIFLMTLDNPSYQLRRAIYYGVNWFDDVRIVGYKVEGFVNTDGLNDRRVVADVNAPDMWARFYTLEDNTPFFCDRDGIKKYSLAEIGYERRNGYSWYGNKGFAVFSAYNTWYSNWGSNTEQETIITSPVSEAIHLTIDTIPVKANANEYAFGCIKKFELYIDDIYIRDYASAKIDTLVANLAVGPHSISVKSTDDKGYITGDTSMFSVVTGYSLTINSGSGNGYYAEGAEVNIKAGTPPDGKEFEKWTGDTIFVTDVNNASTTVTMPASDLSLTAVYKDKISGILDNIAKGKELRCYPNPVNSSFSIDLSSIGNSTIEIYNFEGQIVYQTKVNRGIHNLNDHGLTTGIYLVKVTDEKNIIYTQKIIIK